MLPRCGQMWVGDRGRAKALEPGGCTQQWQFVLFTSARCAHSSSGSCFWQSWGWCLAAAFPGTNARWCLFLTVLHLVLFYENRLQDHHLVIPSVLQGLRALVSLRPPARSAGMRSRMVLGRCNTWVQDGAACRAGPGWAVSSCLVALPCVLRAPAVPLAEGQGRGDCLDFLPRAGIGARIPWPVWGAAEMIGILSHPVCGGGELSLA